MTWKGCSIHPEFAGTDTPKFIAMSDVTEFWGRRGTPGDARQTFFRVKLDGLAIGPFFVTGRDKGEQPQNVNLSILL